MYYHQSKHWLHFVSTLRCIRSSHTVHSLQRDSLGAATFITAYCWQLPLGWTLRPIISPLPEGRPGIFSRSTT